MCSIALSVATIHPSETVFQRLVRLWIAGLAKGMRFEVRAFGVGKLQQDRPYVFMANHLSHLDILAIFSALPMQIGFLSKQELRRVPLLGSVMEMGGHVFIDRKQHGSAMEAMGAAAEQVRAGKHLVIFPEGTRGRAEQIQPFKRGGFHLARKATVPVVPVGLRGTHALLRRGELLPRSGAVEVHVGEPVWPGDFSEVSEFVEVVRRRIGELSGMPLA